MQIFEKLTTKNKKKVNIPTRTERYFVLQHPLIQQNKSQIKKTFKKELILE